MSMKFWVVAPNPGLGAALVAGANSLSDQVLAIVVGADQAIPGAVTTYRLPKPAADQLIEGYATAIAEKIHNSGVDPLVVLGNADVQSRLLLGLVAAQLGVW